MLRLDPDPTRSSCFQCVCVWAHTHTHIAHNIYIYNMYEYTLVYILVYISRQLGQRGRGLDWALVFCQEARDFLAPKALGSEAVGLRRTRRTRRGLRGFEASRLRGFEASSEALAMLRKPADYEQQSGGVLGTLQSLKDTYAKDLKARGPCDIFWGRGVRRATNT